MGLQYNFTSQAAFCILFKIENNNRKNWTFVEPLCYSIHYTVKKKKATTYFLVYKTFLATIFFLLDTT